MLIHTSTGFIISWIHPIYICKHNLQAVIDDKEDGVLRAGLYNLQDHPGIVRASLMLDGNRSIIVNLNSRNRLEVIIQHGLDTHRAKVVVIVPILVDNPGKR